MSDPQFPKIVPAIYKGDAWSIEVHAGPGDDKSLRVSMHLRLANTEMICGAPLEQMEFAVRALQMYGPAVKQKTELKVIKGEIMANDKNIELGDTITDNDPRHKTGEGLQRIGKVTGLPNDLTLRVQWNNGRSNLVKVARVSADGKARKNGYSLERTSKGLPVEEPVVAKTQEPVKQEPKETKPPEPTAPEAVLPQ